MRQGDRSLIPFVSLVVPLRGYHLSGLRSCGILPATAERADEIDARAQLQCLEIERLELRLQERSLRGDDREIVGRALLVERQGEIESTLCSVDGGLLFGGRVVVVIEGRETVLDLLKCSHDGAAVKRGRGVELGARLGN